MTYHTTNLKRCIEDYIKIKETAASKEDFADFIFDKGHFVPEFRVYENCFMLNTPTPPSPVVIHSVIKTPKENLIQYNVSGSLKNPKTTMVPESKLIKGEHNSSVMQLLSRRTIKENIQLTDKQKLLNAINSANIPDERFFRFSEQTAKSLVIEGVLTSRYKPNDKVYIINENSENPDDNENLISECYISQIIFATRLNEPRYQLSLANPLDEKIVSFPLSVAREFSEKEIFASHEEACETLKTERSKSYE